MKSTTDLVNKTAKGIVYVATQKIFYQGVSFLVFAVLARLLEPVDFGLVALTMVYIAFLQLFQDQGFEQAIIHSRSSESGFLSTAFWSNFVLSAIFCLITIVGAPHIGQLFGEPRLEPILIGLAPLLLIRGLTAIQTALLQREMQFRTIAIASIFGVSFAGCMGALAAYSDFGVWSLVIFQLTYKISESFVIWKISSWRPSLEFEKEEWVRLFKFGGNVTGSQIVNFGNRYGAELIIGYFIGPAAVGLYALAFRIVRTIVSVIGSIVSTVSFPVFAQLQEDRETGRKIFLRFSEQISLITFPIFIGLAVCAETAVVLFFGPQWAEAVPLIQVLSIIGVIHSLFYVNNAVLLGYGKPHWQFGLDLLNATTNLCIFVLTVKWGVFAVASGYVMRGVILAPAPLFVINKLLNITFVKYVKKLMSPFFAACVMGAGLVYAKHVIGDTQNLFIELGGLILFGAFLYLVVIRIVSPLLLNDAIRYARKLVQATRG